MEFVKNCKEREGTCTNAPPSPICRDSPDDLHRGFIVGYWGFMFLSLGCSSAGAGVIHHSKT